MFPKEQVILLWFILLKILFFKVSSVRNFDEETSSSDRLSNLEVLPNLKESELVMLGNEFFSEMKFTEAVRCFTMAIEKNCNIEYYRLRANSFINMGNVPLALNDMRKVIRFESSNKNDRCLLNKLLFDSGEFGEAMTETIALNDFDELVKLGDQLMTKEILDKAFNCYTLAIDNNPSKADYHERIGKYYLKVKNHEKAIFEFRTAVQMEPQNQHFRVSLKKALAQSENFNQLPKETFMVLTDKELDTLGIDFYIMKKHKEALRCYTEAIERHLNARYCRMRGLCYWEMNEQGLAISEMHKAVQLEPNNRKYQNHLREALFRCENLNNVSDESLLFLAETDLEKLGNQLFGKKKFVEAERCFKAAIEKNPLKEQFYTMRGRANWNMNEVNSAISDFYMALKIDPTNSNNRDFLCRALLENGRYEEVIKEMPGLDDIQLGVLGDMFFSRNKFEKAALCFTEALNQNCREAKYYNKRGLSFLKLRDLEKALVDLKKAVTIESTSIEYRFDFANALIDAEQFEEARNVVAREYIRANDLVNKDIIDRLEIIRQRIVHSIEQKRREELVSARRQMDEVISNSECALGENEQFARSKIIQLELERDNQIEDLTEAFNKYKARRESINNPSLLSSEERETPNYLLDKISLEIMDNPVITPSGITYERSTISTSLKDRRWDPTSRRPLEEYELRPNRAIKEAISLWKEEGKFMIEKQ